MQTKNIPKEQKTNSKQPLPDVFQRKPRTDIKNSATIKKPFKAQKSNKENPQEISNSENKTTRKPMLIEQAKAAIKNSEESSYTLEKLLSIVDSNLPSIENHAIPPQNMVPPMQNLYVPPMVQPQQNMASPMKKPEMSRKISMPEMIETNLLDLEQQKIREAEEALAAKAKELGIF